jgi:hypothetical protein
MKKELHTLSMLFILSFTWLGVKAGNIAENFRSDNAKEYKPWFSSGQNPWGIPEINFNPKLKPIILGDVNGDGYSDFAVISTVADERTAAQDDKCTKTLIYFGNATGALNYRVEYAGLQPAGDINADGFDDVIALPLNGKYKLLFGGANGFTESAIELPGDFVLGSAFFDFDRDGINDYFFASGYNSYSVIYGNADVSKVEIRPYTATVSFSNPSIVRLEGETVVFFSSRQLARFNSDRTTVEKCVLGLNKTYSQVASADVDGDGKEELIVGDKTRIPHPSSVVAGFTLANGYTQKECGSFYLFGLAGDVNGDVKEEIVYTDENFSGLLLGNVDKTGQLSTQQSLGPLNTLANDISINRPFDFNKDGVVDYPFVYSNNENTGHRVLLGSKSSSFGFHDLLFSSKNFSNMNADGAIFGLGDVNGDGKNEYAMTYNDSVAVYSGENINNAILRVENKEVDTYIRKVFSEDVNADGVKDILVVYCNFDDYLKNRMDVYLGGNTISSTPYKSINFSSALSRTFAKNVEVSVNSIGSVDGDAYPEFMVSLSSVMDTVYLFKGASDIFSIAPEVISLKGNFGDSNLSEDQGLFSSGTRATSIGDVNGDSINDFVVDCYGKEHINFFCYGCLAIFYGKSDLKFTLPDRVLYETADELSINRFGMNFSVGDYNGDGKKDIAVIPSTFTGMKVKKKIEGLYIYLGGSVGSSADKKLFLTAKNVNTGNVDTLSNFGGHLITVPDLDGDKSNELAILYTSSIYDMNYLVMGGSSLRQDLIPAATFTTPSSSYLCQSNGYYSFSRVLSIMDYQGKQVPELIAFQGDPNYKPYSLHRFYVTNPYNKAPEGIEASSLAIPENKPDGTVVGTLTAVDVDKVDFHNFALVQNDTHADNSLFKVEGDKLIAIPSFDFEAKSNYTIMVKVTDASGLSIEKEFAVSITNVNEAPENLALSATVVAENAVAGTVVGILSAQDIDAGDALTYTFASGNGQNDSGNSFFEIEGNVLKSKQPFDFETKNSYSIFVKATDNGGLSIEKEFVVTVTDAVETGIEDGVLNAISVYPNPASERVFVTLPVLANSISVVFTDLSGRMVYQGQFSGMQKVECSLSGVTGTVLVKVVADGKVYTSKVIAE